MRIISGLNEELELNTISTLDEKDHYALFFDFSEKDYCDYYFKKINTFQRFTAPMMKIYIGTTEVLLPLHWRILCVDKTDGLLSMAGVEDILHYKMDALLYNQKYDRYYRSAEMRVAEILTNGVYTFAPKIQTKNLLVIPIEDKNYVEYDMIGRTEYKSNIYVTDNIDNMKNLTHVSQLFVD